MELDTILNIDCLQAMQDLPDECVDLILTDCPYHLVGGGVSKGNKKEPLGILNRRSTKHVVLGGILNDNNSDVRAGKLFKYNDITFVEWLPEVYRVLKPTSHCYIMINARNLKDLQIEAEKAGFIFQNLLVWKKDNVTPNKYYMQQLEFIIMLRKGNAKNINNIGTSNCLSVPNIVGNKKHPTQKPIGLMRILIENSTNKGDIVLDPFMGSGTTAIACMQADRHFIGYEIDTEYYTIAMKRLNEETKQLEIFK